MKKIAALLLVLATAPAFAKLPPLSPEAKAKSDEAAAKAAWSAKVDMYQLCEAQDRVAGIYFEQAKDAGKPTRSPVPTPPCADPGPFAFTPPEEKPLETSGAHSPAGTAIQPPSNATPEAETNDGKK